MPANEIDRAALAALIPHRGSMCLLDRVTSWSDDSIACIALTHRDPSNPLCVNGVLPALSAIEYGAQAMAVHGGLLAARAGTRAVPGYLAAVRDVSLQCQRLDDLAAPLEVQAVRLMADERSLVYEFAVQAGDTSVARGRATVMLNLVAGD